MTKTKNLNQLLADMDDASREKIFDLAVDFPEILPALDDQAKAKSAVAKGVRAEDLLEMEKEQLERLTAD
ncbi:hypothetical protein HZC53_05600 [Candidatus Uhrbacteria bacterium]|nr:hypothetical protein [Candidatus Uhrbacteria bacterium]